MARNMAQTRADAEVGGGRMASVLARLARTMLAVWVLAVPGWGAGAADVDAATLEQRVKAAFLYQFTGYVEWPEQSFARPDTPVTIAVIGADPLAAELSQVVTGRTVGGRTVTVRRVAAGEPLEDVHVLFIGMAEIGRLDRLTKPASARPILTVTESDGALARGSMINFVVDERRVRFDIALDTAERSGLRLSSRLLAVARDVRVGRR